MAAILTITAWIAACLAFFAGAYALTRFIERRTSSERLRQDAQREFADAGDPYIIKFFRNHNGSV